MSEKRGFGTAIAVVAGIAIALAVVATILASVCYAKLTAQAAVPAFPVPSFHVLIATGGRPSLKRMLDSLLPQLTARDAVTIVFDGQDAQKKATFSADWVKDRQCAVHVRNQSPNLGFFGHGIRNKYQTRLDTQTTYIMHADDDDAYTPGAFDALRNLCTDPDVLYVAQMSTKGALLPLSSNMAMAMGNIGTPCGIVPYAQAGKGSWAPQRGGDYMYFHDLELAKVPVKYLKYVIYEVRP
jgi:hypothetical protein